MDDCARSISYRKAFFFSSLHISEKIFALLSREIERIERLRARGRNFYANFVVFGCRWIAAHDSHSAQVKLSIREARNNFLTLFSSVLEKRALIEVS